MAVHTDFRKGQRIRIMPKRKGEPHIVGKYKGSGSGFIFLEGITYPLCDARAIVIERVQQSR